MLSGKLENAESLLKMNLSARLTVSVDIDEFFLDATKLSKK